MPAFSTVYWFHNFVCIRLHSFYLDRLKVGLWIDKPQCCTGAQAEGHHGQSDREEIKMLDLLWMFNSRLETQFAEN